MKVSRYSGILLGGLLAMLVARPSLSSEWTEMAGETDPVKAAKKGWLPAIAPNKHWKTYLIFPWQLVGPAGTNVLKEHEEYTRVNLKAVHLECRKGVYRNDVLEFVKSRKWPFYLGHASGKGTFHLRGEARKSLRQQQIEHPELILPRPDALCLADPATIKKLKAVMTPNIKACVGTTCVAHALDDEVSIGSFNSPLELDAHPLAMKAYHSWLKKEYPTIGALNKQYEKKFQSFEAVTPLSYEKIRVQLDHGHLAKANLSIWMDWRANMNTQFANAIGKAIKHGNDLNPTVPTGVVGLGQASAYGGYDYSKLRKVLQWVEAYNIGASSEILRSFMTQKRPCVQTYGIGGARGDHRSSAWLLWYYMCHGKRGAILWPTAMFSTTKDGQRKVSKKLEDLAPTLKEIQSELSTKVIDGTFLHDPVAIYYSHASITMGWALDSHVHGNTWPRRSSSMDNATLTSGQCRISLLKALEDIGIQGKFTASEDVADGILIKAGYKVLIMPQTYCLSDKEAKAIRAFAKNGGTVIADYMCGIFDEHGKHRGGQGVLDKLFGVSHDLEQGFFAGKVITEINAERGWRFDAGNVEHGVSILRSPDLLKPFEWAEKITSAEQSKTKTPVDRIHMLFGVHLRDAIKRYAAWKGKEPADKKEKRARGKLAGRFLKGLNRIIQNRAFYIPEYFKGVTLPEEAKKLIAQDRNTLWLREIERLNRLLLEASFPGMLNETKDTQFSGHYAGVASCERGLKVTSGKAQAKANITGAPVVVKHGRAIYLNLSPLSYALARKEVDGSKFRKLLSGILMDAGVSPRCTITQDGKPVKHSVECLYWEYKGRTIFCVIGNFSHWTSVENFGVHLDGTPSDERTFTLHFAEPVKDMKNERTGKKVGAGKSFTFAWKPWEAAIFSYRR